MKDFHISATNVALQALLVEFQRKEYLFSDPIQFIHQYSDPRDQEVVGLVSSLFSYGSVSQILKAIHCILKPLGEHPADILSKEYKGKNLWPGFYYRFHREGHIVVLAEVLADLLKEYGLLSAYFKKGFKKKADLEGVLSFVSGDFRERAFKRASPDLVRGFKFLFNSPKDGSACKRLCMFMRWMVRKDEIDVGIWDWFPKEKLVIPSDTHIARLSYYLGLRKGKEMRPPSWKMALEITERLREVSAKDPVSFDFALTRLGILDLCKRRYEKTICENCLVVKGCQYARSH